VFDMRKRFVLSTLLLALVLHAGLARSEQLTVQNESGKQTVLTRADIEALPHVKVPSSVSGGSATFEGVALRAVLERGGVGFGETMKGKRMASCLLVEAAVDIAWFSLFLKLTQRSPTNKLFLVFERRKISR
jgi:hypothetical protein